MNMKQCPHCGQVAVGANYCSQCGTKLVYMPNIEETCPCCGGTGKIKRHSEPWYRWQYAQPQAVINTPTMFEESNMTVHNGENPFTTIKVKVGE